MNVGQMLYQPVFGKNESRMGPGMMNCSDAIDATTATTAGDIQF